MAPRPRASSAASSGLYPVKSEGAALLEAEMVLATPDAKLRAVGLSFAKIASIKDLAQKTLDGVVPPYEILHTLGNEEIIERITQVRGIGRWTVEMLLMFRLGRPDVLPVDDFGVRNGFRLAYGLRGMPTVRALAEYGARWAPYPLGGRVVPVARGRPAPRRQTTRARHRTRVKLVKKTPGKDQARQTEGETRQESTRASRA